MVSASSGLKISTHALTWSATCDFLLFHISQQDFNSRAHVERDPPQQRRRSATRQFQLTRSRGARQAVLLDKWIAERFQLTRSRGARLDEGYIVGGLKTISTHALTWSATRVLPYHFLVIQISTHALTWSATASRMMPCTDFKFQLTRSRGARRCADCLENQTIAFQLTRSRGARQNST